VDSRVQVQLEQDGDCSTEQSSKMGTNGVCGLCSTASDKQSRTSTTVAKVNSDYFYQL